MRSSKGEEEVALAPPWTQAAAPFGGQWLTVLDYLGEGVAVFDREDRFVLWNQRYADLYALLAPLLRPGLSFRTFMEEGVEVGQFLDAAGGEQAWLTERLKAREGPTPARERLIGDRWVRVQEHRLADGALIRVVTDVTGLKRTETSFRLLFDANPVPMCLVDAKTLAFLDVNEAAVRTYGYLRDDFLAMTMPDLAAPEQAASVSSIMRSDLGSYSGQEIWSQLTADGRILKVRPYVQALNYEGRKCLFAAAVDVTEAVTAELDLYEQLRVARNQLAQVLASATRT